MKISTKGRYAVRFLMDLARRKTSVPMALGEIARHQNISEKYLWHVVTPLKKAGLLNAVPGPRGGYSLAQPANQITMRDILAAVEDGISLVECVDRSDACCRSDVCTARSVWLDLSRKIEDITGSVTLEDMISKQPAMPINATPDYVI